jgi:putative ABC transport system permease protein
VTRATLIAVSGIAIGAAGATGLTRLIEAYLFGARATDVVNLLVVALVILVIVLKAALIPARRAAGVIAALLMKSE